MTNLLARVRGLVAVLAVLTAMTLASPVGAQQRNPDGAVNPTASAVQEEQLLDALKGGTISGRVSIPDRNSSNLIQPAGRDWRAFHEGTMHTLGYVTIIGMVALCFFFYLIRGRIKIKGGRSGRLVTRFTWFERFIHWMTATCFLIMAVTGLNITFGKSLLLPLIGPEAFAAFSQWGKYAHNYLSFPFTLGVVVIFLMWIGGNIPNKVDLEWLRKGGGLVRDDHPPSYRFNAGQKGIYWAVVLGGGLMAFTGYLLMFPFYATDVTGMQTVQIVHGVVAAFLVAIMLAHIYIGSVGMEGAFEAMGRGTVDYNWAREHHDLWLEKEHASTGPNDATPQAQATPAE